MPTDSCPYSETGFHDFSSRLTKWDGRANPTLIAAITNARVIEKYKVCSECFEERLISREVRKGSQDSDVGVDHIVGCSSPRVSHHID